MGRLLLVRPSEVLDGMDVDDDLRLTFLLIAALHEEAERIAAG